MDHMNGKNQEKRDILSHLLLKLACCLSQRQASLIFAVALGLTTHHLFPSQLAYLLVQLILFVSSHPNAFRTQ